MIIDVAIVLGLIILSGLFSGLTLGLMSLKPHELARKAQLGNQHAKNILPIRRRGNLLLCTLLLGNVLVNSILAIFLGNLTTGIIAAIVSTALIVTFGEILPQAILSRHALLWGSRLSGLVKVFIVLLYPVTYPLSKGLDKMLGDELPSEYGHREMRLILRDQQELNTSKREEFEYAQASLRLRDVKVADIMTPDERVYFVTGEQRMTQDFYVEIQRNGHSRIPVLSAGGNHVIGVLYVKDLIRLKPNPAKTVRMVMREGVVRVSGSDRASKLLELFKQKRIHLFIVVDAHRDVIGIVTLEDVIEEIIGEVIDEFDRDE